MTCSRARKVDREATGDKTVGFTSGAYRGPGERLCVSDEELAGDGDGGLHPCPSFLREEQRRTAEA